MDPRCSVIHPTNKLSLTASAAMIAIIVVTSIVPTHVDAHGKAKAAPSPQTDRKSTRLNSSHRNTSRMPSSA